MPTYEYECESCGYRFEMFQPITAAPVRKCSRCGGRVHRLIAPVGIIFKGSGFHVNDYTHYGPKGSGSNGRKDGKKKSEDMAEVIKSTETSESSKKVLDLDKEK